MDTVSGRAEWGRIGLAAGASVAASAGWYTAWGDRLARLDEVYAREGPPPPWILPVELARSTAVATAVAVLADATGRRGTGAALRRGLGLWGAFPVVLLTGSVVHENVPWQQAAIHAGDWLVKLLLISLVVGRGRPRR
jgi:hypothetical protein